MTTRSGSSRAVRCAAAEDGVCGAEHGLNRAWQRVEVHDGMSYHSREDGYNCRAKHLAVVPFVPTRAAFIAPARSLTATSATA